MIDVKSVERLAYGYELMHRAICNLAGTSGADPRWYMEVAQIVQRRVSPIFEVGPDSNPHKPGDCLSGYKAFASDTPEPAAQPLYDRLVKLAEMLAERNDDTGDEARAIIAELRPVDPDLVLARNLAADVCAAIGNCCDYVQFMRDGHYDDKPEVRAALAGIRGRVVAVDGRELAVQS